MRQGERDSYVMGGQKFTVRQGRENVKGERDSYVMGGQKFTVE